MVSSLSSFVESRATPGSGADAHSSSANRNNNDNNSSESYRRQAPYYLSSFREQRGERALAATPGSMAPNTSYEDSNGERHSELMDERILNLIAASASTATTVSTATEVACRHHHPRRSSRSIMTLPSVQPVSSNMNPSPDNLKAPPAHSYNVHLNSDKQRALHQISNENKATQIWKYLPLQWQHDKDFILEALHNHSAPLPHKSDFERTFPQSLRFDKDIVLAFCHRPDFVLKTKTEFSDTVVEGICTPEQDDTSSQCEGDDYHGLYYERHLFVPGCLTNDKDVMLAYCSKIPRSLQDCSEELCNDRDVVVAAITHCSGLELQYASIQLQQDIDMVKLACQNHGRSLEFCPPLSTTRQLLIQDRDFMLNVVLSNPGGGSMWKILPKHLQENDEELILRALQNGLLLRDVPTSYVSVDFLQQAIRNNCKLYLQLNTINNHQASLNWQQHPTLAFEAILSENSTPAVHALALGPDGCLTLRENRQVFVSICKRGSLELLQDLLGHTVVTTNTNNNHNNDLAEEAALQDMFDAHGIHGQLLPLVHPRVVLHAPGLVNPPEPPVPQAGPPAAHRRSRFCDDMDIMKLAVTRNPSFFSAASLRLQAEPELILASITRSSAWNTLKTVPWSIQRQYPEITIKAITLCDSRNLRYLPTHIPEEMWVHHRDICMAWIRRGGRVLDVFERMLRTDPEMGLLVAKHNWSEFYKVGDRWLNDRDFVLQALDLDGRVLRFASVNLRQDFDIMLRAVANYFNNMPLGIQHQSTTPSVSQALSGILDLDSLKREIQRLLDLHQLYLKEFLRAISVKTPRLAPALRSQLTMLDRGIETSQAFKRLIAEYLGVPVGAKLAMLRKAHENLQRPPPSTSTRSSIFDATWDDPLLGRPDDGGAMERHAIRRFRFMARRHRELLHINEGNNHGGDDDDDDDAGLDMDGFLGVPTRRTRELEMQERIAATAAGRTIGATRFTPPLQTPGALFHPFAGMNGNDNINNNMDTLRTRAERMRSHRGSARAVMMAQDFAGAMEQRAQHQREAFREQHMHELEPYGLRRIETRVGRRLPEETDANNNDDDAPSDATTNNNNAAATTGAITRTRNVARVNFGRESMTMFQENNLRQQQPILADFRDWGPTVANPARAMSMSDASSTVSIEVGSTERDLLEAERRRQSDEMLARLEARNARSRAAEQARAFEEGGIHAVWAINAEQQVNDPPVPLLDPRNDRGLTVPRSRRRSFGTRPFLRVDHEDDDIDDDDDDDDLVDVDDDALFSDMLYAPDDL